MLKFLRTRKERRGFTINMHKSNPGFKLFCRAGKRHLLLFQNVKISKKGKDSILPLDVGDWLKALFE